MVYREINSDSPAVELQRPIGVFVRLCLWLSILLVGLVVTGIGAFAIFFLAHHAAPAGGGG